MAKEARPAPPLLTENEVLKLLDIEIAKAGSQYEWAKRAGVDRPTLNAILHRRRRLQPKVLLALGLKKVVAYSQA